MLYSFKQNFPNWQNKYQSLNMWVPTDAVAYTSRARCKCQRCWYRLLVLKGLKTVPFSHILLYEFKSKNDYFHVFTNNNSLYCFTYAKTNDNWIASTGINFHFRLVCVLTAIIVWSSSHWNVSFSFKTGFYYRYVLFSKILLYNIMWIIFNFVTSF